MKKNNEQEVYEIDLLRLVKVMWQHVVLIVLTTVIGGILGFSIARFAVVPQYQAKALLYVNNSSINIGGSKVSISTGELSAAQSLVDTYIVILNSRITLNEVINKADLKYSYEELSKMVSASAVNNTEVFRVTVTSPDPAEAKLIANTIADTLPKTISNVVDGSDVRVVDYAVTPVHRSSPSYTKYTAIGLVIGGLLSAGFVVIRDLLDDIIHDADYLRQTYSEIPVLSMIPDLDREGSNGYKYDYRYKYKSYKSYGYGGYGGYGQKNEPQKKQDGKEENKQ